MIYDYPEYYNVAFSFRNIDEEVDFMQQCIKKFSFREVKTVLEPGCGTAPHARGLIECSYRYIGLDLNDNMLKYAVKSLAGVSPAPEFVKGDMRHFELNEKADFAFIMLGSLSVNQPDDLIRHFDSMAASLESGALYFMDSCVQFTDPLLYHKNSDYCIEQNGIKIESKFDIRLINEAEATYEEVWEINVEDRGRVRQFKMVEQNRAIYPDKFLEFLNDRADFELVGWWADWSFDKRIRPDQPVTRPVVLLRRK